MTSPFDHSPASNSFVRESDRLLELELMHRWSIRSWTYLYLIPDCQFYCQNYLPRAALQHSYVMNMLLASAAADLAMSSNGAASARYLRAALKHSNRASADFRVQVTEVTRENIDLIVYHAFMTAALHFATFSWRTSSIERASVFFHMIAKSIQIVVPNLEWYLDSPCAARTARNNYARDFDLMKTLEPETLSAISLLSSVSRQVRIAATNSMDSQHAGAEGPLANDILAYKLAVAQAKYCFAEDHNGRFKACFILLPVVCGAEFAAGVRRKEPMAIFIIMYWGVLLDRSSKDPWMWILASTGRDLVAETSEMLQCSQIARIPGVRDGIAWARRQVNLPPLAGCVWTGATNALALEWAKNDITVLVRGFAQKT